jgi:hypothetical protein
MIVAHRMLVGLALLLLPAAVAAPEPGGVPVVMTAQPRTALDRTARGLVARDLAEAARSGERPLVLIGSARLGAASDRPVLFVQLQSPRQCGSRGCSIAAYAWIKGRWTKVLDDASGRVTVASTRHGGMADLAANSERYVWDGTAYANTRPAPAIDLRPRGPHPRRPG